MHLGAERRVTGRNPASSARRSWGAAQDFPASSKRNARSIRVKRPPPDVRLSRRLLPACYSRAKLHIRRQLPESAALQGSSLYGGRF